MFEKFFAKITGLKYSSGSEGIDPATESLQMVSYEHHEIHEGSHFFICDTQALANGEVVDFTLTTPNTAKWTHMNFRIEGTGAISLEIFEGATVDAAGAAVIVYNNDRNSVNASSDTVRSGDTFTAEGTVIYHVQSGANKVVGILARDRELILKQNTVYIFRITNETAVANQLSYCAEWYEHTSKN